MTTLILGNHKRISLAELGQHLKRVPQPARARQQRLPERAFSPPLPADDDLAAFRQAIAGAVALRPNQRVEIERPAPPPVPRPRVPEKELALPPSHKNELALPESWFAQPAAAPIRTPDQTLLAWALKGVRPIVSDRVFVEPSKPPPIPIQHQRDEQAALDESIYAPTPLELRLEGGDELAYLREGLPRSLLGDLRRGRWVVQTQLDLHGATRDEARDLLAAFVTQCRKQAVRCVRIVHGKGLGSPGKEPVLKHLVAGWLINYDDVLAYAQARVHDGGAGALMVLLKTPRR